MINAIGTFSEYVNRYMPSRSQENSKWPGEHHFVAAYLLPRLFNTLPIVPNYINPDGTKDIIGDVTYYQDDNHKFAIEVKMGTIRLTKNQFNKWIENPDQTQHPNLFIAVGTKGLCLLSWLKFVEYYKRAVQKRSGEPPKIGKSGYGSFLGINELIKHVDDASRFETSQDPKNAAFEESRFQVTLKENLLNGVSLPQ
ncbi:MAG: hypothetical protein HC904_12000 [Blastochloris sp.]|nr:hypothetical protein [Blastochloris sp.]